MSLALSSSWTLPLSGSSVERSVWSASFLALALALPFSAEVASGFGFIQGEGTTLALSFSFPHGSFLSTFLPLLEENHPIIFLGSHVLRRILVCFLEVV